MDLSQDPIPDAQKMSTQKSLRDYIGEKIHQDLPLQPNQENGPDNNHNLPTYTPDIMTEFKHSIHNIWAPMLNDTTLIPASNHVDEIKPYQHESITRFIDLARQLETFFAQHRLMLSNSETQLSNEIDDLKLAISRKDSIIKAAKKKLDRYKIELAEVVPEILCAEDENLENSEANLAEPPIESEFPAHNTSEMQE